MVSQGYWLSKGNVIDIEALIQLPAVYTAGIYLDDGLPNLTGQYYVACLNNGVYSDSDSNNYGVTLKTGVFSGSRQRTQSEKHLAAGYHEGTSYNIDFNASKSNSIYGKSTTVQPPALTSRYFVKYQNFM